MTRRVVSVWLPTFATDLMARRLVRRRPTRTDWRARPLATAGAVQGGMRIEAASPAAESGGVRPGLTLADARALVPGLVVAEADPAGDRQALEDLADWCGRYTPWTAVDDEPGGPGAGGFMLDVTGCAHLFGGESALARELVSRLAALGLRARAAVADTPGAAWAAARFLAGDGATAVVAEGEAMSRLAALPVAALRLAPADVDALVRVGLRELRDLVALPRAPLAARFGEATLRRLDQALGRADEPISPRRPVPPLRVRLAFAEPIVRSEDLACALRHLLAETCRRLEEGRQGARRLELALYRTDGTAARADVGTSQPVRDSVHLARLFAGKIERLDCGFGVEVAILATLAADPLPPAQERLETGAAADDPRPMARLVDRLGNRLAGEGVLRLAPQASHVPERACREVSALVAVPPATDPKALTGEMAPRRPRPLYLLPWPEPVEAVAPVPDDPPVMFRWRRRAHRVVRAEGPERIGPEWWREDPSLALASQQRVRDYYRIEDADGRRFWLYRDGLYLPGARPRWYLHGFFP